MRLVQLCFDFYMMDAKPKNLIGGRAYNSNPLDADDGIEMIVPTSWQPKQARPRKIGEG